MTLEMTVQKQLRFFDLSIDLMVRRGEVLVLIGENGAGKTTVLNLIAGLLTPDQGCITLNNRWLFCSNDQTDLPPEQRRIGFVFQHYALFPHLSVRENVGFGLRAKKIPKDQVADVVERKLAMVELTRYADQRITTLSGGQQQRTALARALVTEPDLLLLDELLAALDPQTRTTMRSEVRRCIKKAGTPAVIVSHTLEDTLFLGDRICLIEEGTITHCGTPEEMISTEKNRFLESFFCGCTQGTAAAPIRAP